MPKSVRAAEAIKANPEKSDRAIAADIGVSDTTVLRARKEQEWKDAFATASHEAVEKRIGLDGKKRRLPIRELEDFDGVRPPSPLHKKQYLMGWCEQIARVADDYDGPCDQEILDFITAAVARLLSLKNTLMEGKS